MNASTVALATRMTPILLGVFLTYAPSAGAELWRSPLHDLTYVQVEKLILAETYDPPNGGAPPTSAEVEPLPQEILASLGNTQIDYPTFVAAYLAPKALNELLVSLDARGLDYSTGRDRTIQLPYHAFEAGGADRVAPGFSGAFAPVAISGRFLVQFAYPPRSEWLAAIEACGGKIVTPFPVWTLLVDAPSLETLTGCSASGFFSLIDAHLSTDRLSPEIAKGDDFAEISLEYPAGVSLAQKASSLASSLDIEPVAEPVPGEHGFLQVKATPADLASVVAIDRELLALCPEGQAIWSDER